MRSMSKLGKANQKMSIAPHKSAICRRLKSFLRNSAGNTTMALSLSIIPVIAAVGAGVDYARINKETTLLAAAVDSALLAVISSEKSDISGLNAEQRAQRMSEIETLAEGFLESNYKPESGSVSDLDAHIVINGDKVTMTAAKVMPMSFMSFMAVETVTINVQAEANRSKQAAIPVEIALVMDTTGSMGSTYMSQAKTAARNLLTTLYGGDKATKKENQNLRVSLVPFAAAVRLDRNAYDFDMDWIDTTGASSVSKLNFSSTSWHNYQAWTELNNQPWNGCVEARSRGSAPFDYNVNDAPPLSGNSLFVPYFAPDEPTFSGSTSSPYNFDNSYISNSGTPRETTGISTSTSSSNWSNRQRNVNKYVNKTITAESSSSYGPWYNCTKSAVVPMTYNRDRIEDGITAMSASGNTLIPEGLAWGWRTLSPGEPFTKVEAGPTIPADTISDYGDKWKKVLVLMTDGENDISAGLNSMNGSTYNAYGYVSTPLANNRFGTTSTSQAESRLDDAMLELCANIKAEGIEIYTVAFRVSSTSILNKLKACASSDDHYSRAADGTQLSEVFTSIGEAVKSTRVYLSK